MLRRFVFEISGVLFAVRIETGEVSRIDEINQDTDILLEWDKLVTVLHSLLSRTGVIGCSLGRCHRLYADALFRREEEYWQADTYNKFAEERLVESDKYVYMMRFLLALKEIETMALATSWRLFD